MREIEIIPSKSDAHRAMICAALSKMTSGKDCRIDLSAVSKDIEATAACLSALQEGREEMRCGESGSTLRFLLPVCGALGRTASFYGEGRLPQRPLSPLYEELAAHGCTLSPAGQVPLTIRGQLTAGVYRLPGNVSSQYISGLLFALPLLKGDSQIIIEGELQSKSYVEMTQKTLADFGIRIETSADSFRIPGGQSYEAPQAYKVEGDWSNGCFWLTAGALTEGGICVKNLNPDSLQGDKAILSILKKFGADVKIEAKGITVCPGEEALHAVEIDGSQIPDMVPVLAAAACGAEGTTVIRNAGRLRMKESDRLAATAQTLAALGAEIEERADGLVITGISGNETPFPLKGGTVDSVNDHRIAMMAAVASLLCRDTVTITGADAVNKSYPGFFEDLRKLGLDGRTERK